MTEDTESKSWAEYVRKIKQEKVTLPWNQNEIVPPKRMTTFDKTRQERQFNPILQKFRDTRVETTRKQAEAAYRTDVLNRSKAREVKYGQPYNILRPTAAKLRTFEETQNLIRTLPSETQIKIKEQNHTKRMRASRVDYNILSNMSTQEHHYAPPGQRPAPLPPPRHGSGPGKPTVESSATMKRDYNIISGRYRNHHSKRVDKDNQNLSNKAAERFWQTHDFNPVTCEFYDQTKESLFKEARGVFEQSHGAVQRRRLPPKIRDSDGYLYDIVSMRTKDEEGLKTMITNKSGGGNTLHKAAVEERIRQKQNARYDLVEKRKMNRVAAKRFDEMTKHGYDLVTGQPYKGKGAKVVPRPVHMSRAPGVWQRAENAGLRHEKRGGSTTPISSSKKYQNLERSASSATPVLLPNTANDTTSETGSRRNGEAMDATVFNDTMDGPETGRSGRLGGTTGRLGSAAQQILSRDDSKGLVPKLDMTKTVIKKNTGRVRTSGF
jgi:hypothetical protein